MNERDVIATLIVHVRNVVARGNCMSVPTNWIVSAALRDHWTTLDPEEYAAYQRAQRGASKDWQVSILLAALERSYPDAAAAANAIQQQEGA